MSHISLITTRSLAVALLFLVLSSAFYAEAKKKASAFDVFNHEMHTPIYESSNVPCETCHADPESYGNREKINKQGCHQCHKAPAPIMPVIKDCKTCHFAGFPKPMSHKVSWISKHQSYAKNDPASCAECHSNQMFCMDCHSRRDTIQERMHMRNFKFYHSIEARANPKRCNACHTVSYCQDCHAGRANSSK